MLGAVLLLPAEVQERGRGSKVSHQLLLELRPVFLQHLSVVFFKALQGALIFLGCCLEFVVPVSVELLVLFNVSIFAVLALLLMHKEHLFHGAKVLLLFELSDAVFSQFCLHVTPVTLAQLAMFLHCLTIEEFGFSGPYMNSWIDSGWS